MNKLWEAGYYLAHLLESYSVMKRLTPVHSIKHKARRKLIEQLPPGKSLQIDRHKKLSSERFHQDYLKTGTPVIFQGQALDWPCHKKWSLDFFDKFYGLRQALLIEAEGLTGHQTRGTYQVAQLAQVLNEIRAQKRESYLRFSPLVGKDPRLQEDLDLSWLEGMRNPRSRANGFQFFMGAAFARTYLHCDMQCNFFVMVKGSKRWRLVPTAYTPILNPSAQRGVYNHSELDLYAPDTERYQGLDKLCSYDFVLEEGDILYNPPFMWHDVTNLTETVAVSYRFGYLPGYLMASKTFSLMRILATKPSLWQSMKLTDEDINLIYASTYGNLDEVALKLRRDSNA